LGRKRIRAEEEKREVFLYSSRKEQKIVFDGGEVEGVTVGGKGTRAEECEIA